MGTISLKGFYMVIFNPGVKVLIAIDLMDFVRVVGGGCCVWVSNLYALLVKKVSLPLYFQRDGLDGL